MNKKHIFVFIFSCSYHLASIARPAHTLETYCKNPPTALSVLLMQVADIDAICAALTTVVFFSRLDEPTVRSLAQCVQYERFHAKQTVFKFGDYGDKYYLLLTGRVGIEVPIPQQDGGVQMLQVAILEPGAGFGEMALLEDKPRAATIDALELTEALCPHLAALSSGSMALFLLLIVFPVHIYPTTALMSFWCMYMCVYPKYLYIYVILWVHLSMELPVAHQLWIARTIRPWPWRSTKRYFKRRGLQFEFFKDLSFPLSC